MRPRTLAQLLGVAATLFLLIFYLYPLLVIVRESFSQGLQGGMLVAAPYYLGRLGFTAFQAALSTLLTVGLGLPGAILFARYDFPGKRFARSAFTVPFVMPTVVAAIGWLALVGPNGLTGIDLRNSLLLILLAHVFYNYGLVVRLVGGYLENAAPSLRAAAATLGATPWRILWRVTLPTARPAVLAAAALVFVFTFTSFGVILILAPSPELATLEVEIYRLSDRLLRLDAAAVLALSQLLVILLASILYTRFQARLAVPLAGAGLPPERPRGVARVWLLVTVAGAALLVLSPLLALTLQAFWQDGGLSLANVRALLAATPSIGFAGLGPALLNSLGFALASGTVALLLGFAFAYAVVRGGWRWLDAASLLPIATSAVTLGFGYLLAFPELVVSRGGLVVAHALVAFPLVTRALLPGLRGLRAELAGAAHTLGAGPLRTLLRVELPLLRPSLIAASSFAFVVSMGEFGATLVITRPEFATLPVAIFDRLGRPGAANYGSALVLAVILMVITAAVMLLLDRPGRSGL